MICRACLRACALSPAMRSEFSAVSPTHFPRSLSSQQRPISQSIILSSRLSQRPHAALPAPRPYSTTPDSPGPSSPPVLEKPAFDTEAEGKVWDRLVAELTPSELWVQDISGGCGSMYGIEIASERFRGLNMLKQQRLVNAALGEMVKEWHGVQIKTRVP